MSDLDKCSLLSDFTLLKAAVRGQHYQDAECKNARQLNRSTTLKLAIQLKLAIAKAAPRAGMSKLVLKTYDFRF